MIQSLLDIKKLKRNVDLINNNNPEENAEVLQKILNEALLAFSSGNVSLQQSASDELKNIRNSIITQQIDAGSKTSNYTMAFNSMISDFERVLENADKSSDTFSSVIESVSVNLPSVDTLTTALITANPLLGYGVKMVRDMFKKNNLRKMELKKDEQRKKELYKTEKEKLNSIINSTEKQSELIENINTSVIEQVETTVENVIEPKKRSYNTLSKKLDNKFIDNTSDIFSKIEENTRSVNKDIRNSNESALTNEDSELLVIEDSTSEVISNKILEQVTEQTESLDNLVKVEAYENEIQENLVRDNQIDLIEEERKRKELMTQQTTNSKLENSSSKKEDDNIDLGIGMGFNGNGIIGSIRKFFSMLLSLKGFVGMVGKFAIVGTVINGLVDFIDGFYSAEKYFNGEIGIKERIITGISSVVSGFVDIIDKITNFFGFDFIKVDKEQMTKTVINGILELESKVSELFNSFKNTIKEKFNSIIDLTVKFFDDSILAIKDIIKTGKEFISNKIKGVFGIEDDNEVDIQTSDNTQELEDKKSFLSRFGNWFEDEESTTQQSSITVKEMNNNIETINSKSKELVESVPDLPSFDSNNTIINAPNTTNIVNQSTTESRQPLYTKNNESDIQFIRNRNNYAYSQ